jgi:hypothetical protein
MGQLPLHAPAVLRTYVFSFTQSYIFSHVDYVLYKTFRPYSPHNLQIFLPRVFVYTIFYFSRVQFGICLGSLELRHVH